MISTNIIYIDNFYFKITNKNNSIQISIFNNDKVSKQKKITYKYSNMEPTEYNFNILNINKVLFLRENIKRENEEYCAVKSYVEFKGFRDDNNEEKNLTVKSFLENYEENNISNLKEIINNLKNNKNVSYYFFQEEWNYATNNELCFDNNNDYYSFDLEIPIFEDVSNTYSIKIKQNKTNKNKIIKLFETYLKIILSLKSTKIYKKNSTFSFCS